MKWDDLHLELLNEHNEWVKVVSVKPEEFQIAESRKGVFIWHDTRKVELRIRLQE
jgi:hypothetical protein